MMSVYKYIFYWHSQKENTNNLIWLLFAAGGSRRNKIRRERGTGILPCLLQVKCAPVKYLQASDIFRISQG